MNITLAPDATQAQVAGGTGGVPDTTVGGMSGEVIAIVISAMALMLVLAIIVLASIMIMARRTKTQMVDLEDRTTDSLRQSRITQQGGTPGMSTPSPTRVYDVAVKKDTSPRTDGLSTQDVDVAVRLG